MAYLRGPTGCPWDRAQDYTSMKGLLLEEAYEVADAVNSGDCEALKDELGDLLFQVIFYCRLAEEANRFSLAEVMENLHAKLVRRHPHVFGASRARTAAQALESWNAVKEAEHQAGIRECEAVQQSDVFERTTDTEPRTAAIELLPEAPTAPRHASVLDGIPQALPALLEAYEQGVCASEAGFEWTKLEDLLNKIGEELGELRRELAVHAVNSGRTEEEVGDLLFAVASLSRYLGSDPESCLRRANQKFSRRFRMLEQEVAKRGKKVRECTHGELANIWGKVKRIG